MSTDKPPQPVKAPQTHRIVYVSFLTPVPIGGDVASIEFWSEQKHGPSAREPIELEDRGHFLLLYPCRKERRDDGTDHVIRHGSRRRIPMTNVGVIREDPL